MTTTAVATPETFQERMFIRIRESMGDLMTDDDLKKVVDTAMQKAFFEERRIQDGYHTKTLQPYFVELIQKEMKDQVSNQISAWIAEHPEEVSKCITETLEKGIYGMMVSHFESKMHAPLWELNTKLSQKGLL